MRLVARLRERPVLALGLLAALLFLAGGGGLLWLNTPRHRITRESHDKIQLGMTRAEVEEILGVPPGDYGPGPVFKFEEIESTMPVRLTPECDSVEWLAEDVGVFVDFDPEGRVFKKGLGAVTREDFLSRLRRWLGL